MLVLGLIFATISSASVTNRSNDLNCREGLAKFDENLSLTAQVEQDLLNGVWTQGSREDFQTVVQFTDEGKALFLNAVKAGAVYETGRYSWEVVVLIGDPILILQDQRTGEVRQYLVEQTCQGINLVDPATGHKESFDYTPAHRPQQNRQESALTGSWENILASVTLSDNCAGNADSHLEMKKVSLRFEFRRDGTFTRVLKSRDAQVRFQEEGRWEISKDGRNLLLHSVDSEGHAVTQCAKIKHLEMDELVLEQPLAVVGRRFASVDNEDFFFNKQ